MDENTTITAIAARGEAGIRLKAADPERRLVQLLSENKDIFQSDRRYGWSLKGEAPAATGASGATESGLDLI